MSFYKLQSIVTLAGRLAFFGVLFFSFSVSGVVKFPLLSDQGSAALLALVIALPIGHASSFWFMTAANLSAISFVYAALTLLFQPTDLYDGWRRLTFGGFLPFVLCGAYLLFGAAKAKYVVKTRYTVSCDMVLASGGFRIVHLSDIHPGNLGSARDAARLYGMIDGENPDMVVLCGDIFDENTKRTVFRRYLDVFSALHPKYGIYFVYGNHDIAYHWKKPSYTREELADGLRNAGVVILEDEAAVTAGGTVTVIGRRSLTESRLDARELISPCRNNDRYTIVLCHEPVELSEIRDAGADLILCGHTHGGQIFPAGMISEKILKLHEAGSGMTDLGGGCRVIVSTGVGTWSYPVRTEGKSEIVVIDVTGKIP